MMSKKRLSKELREALQAVGRLNAKDYGQLLTLAGERRRCSRRQSFPTS